MARARPSSPPDPLDRLLGTAPALQALRAQIRHLARFDAVGHAAVPTVLLQGETGTGKGLVARVIHDSGPRASGPFIEVNCAAIPETLLEAELFGVEAGAFTDAKHVKPGLFEAALGGTLFLDEIEALPLPLQSKCLTAVETKRVRRVGAVVEHSLDVKLIAATQVALGEHVLSGRFRADLYHRLAVVVLELPPLRERGDDILVLARAFVQQYGVAYGVGPQRLSQAAEAWLRGHHWPGNVRELSHLLERVALLETVMVIDPESLARRCLPPSVPDASTVSRLTPPPGAPLHEIERLVEAVRHTGGNLAAAARLVGLSRSTLRRRMHAYGLTRPSLPQAFPLVRQETDASDPPPSAPPPIVSSARREEPPVVPSPQTGEGQGEAASARRDASGIVLTHRTSAELATGWVPKPVAVLAIEATWSDRPKAEGRPYEPWTVASHWEQRLAEKVAGFGGVILQGSASLLLVAFGLPQTLDQLPQRAVQAALAIRHLAADTHAFTREMPSPVVRLAAHLGTLLVAEATGESPWRWLAVGETLALPVRLLGHAAPGELLVSAQMARLTDGWIEVQTRRLSSGAHSSNPRLAYRVGGLLPRQGAHPGSRWRARTPFLGRAHELAMLQAVLAQVESGRGQLVGIVGNPGMGKSRLLAEWRHSLAARQVTYLEGHCWSYGRATPYLPVLDLLRAHCGITPADRAEIMAEKVREGLQAVDMAVADGAPYLLHLLEIQSGTEMLVGINPETLKAKTFEALRQICLHRSQQHPLIIAVENLHWIDPTSDAFFARLADSIAGAAILVLATYRPGYQPPWLDKSYATQLTLAPLSPEDSVQIVRTVLSTETVPAPLAQTILAKAQGNPFFLEEIAQTLVEQGTLRREGGMTLPLTLQLPATVQAVLAARIDRLPPEEKQLLQIAAVIGTEVPVPLLQAMAERPEAALHHSLAHLQAAEFLYETRLFPEHEYTFKHVLTQQVAYETLLQERRRALHAGIVEALETLIGDRVAEQVERLAQHALRGEVWAKALLYGRQAGEKAMARSAYREAVGYFEQALSVLPHLPETRDTREQAIDLRLDLRSALLPSGDSGLNLLREAESLAEGLDDPRRLGQISRFLSLHFFHRGAHDQAIASAQRALALATVNGDGVLQVLANLYLGRAHQAQGDYRRAIDCLLETVTALDAIRRHERFGQIALPAVNARAYLAWCHAELGTFAEGRALGDEGLRIAEEVAHPGSLIYAFWGIGLVAVRQGDLCTALSMLDRAVGLCQEANLSAWFPLMAAAMGAAYTLAGRVADAVPLLTQAMEQSRATEMIYFQALCRLRLGEAQLLAGRLEEAHPLAERALAHARAHQERGHEAYALQLLGDIAAQRNPPESDQAEAHYRQALTLADELAMRPLQAHCHRGLGILYATAGQREQARAELGNAIEMYRTMDMTFWLPQAERALAQVEDHDEY